MEPKLYSVGDRVHVINTEKNQRPGKDGTILEVQSKGGMRQRLKVLLDGSLFEVWTTNSNEDVRPLA